MELRRRRYKHRAQPYAQLRRSRHLHRASHGAWHSEDRHSRTADNHQPCQHMVGERRLPSRPHSEQRTCVQVDARDALSAVAVYARRHNQRKDRRQGGVRRQSPVGRLAGAAQHADREAGQGGRRDGVQERSAEPRYAAVQRGSQQHRHAEGYRLLPPYLARQRGGNAQRCRDKHRRDRPLLGTDHLFGRKHAARSVHRYKQQRESEGEVDGKCG